MRERYRRNEDRIISECLFTREDIDEMDNSLEDVEEEDIIEDVDQCTNSKSGTPLTGFWV